MNKTSTFIILLLFFALSCKNNEVPKESEKKSPLIVQSSVDKAIATTNDEITYSIIFNHKKDISFTLPEIGSEIAGFRVIDFGDETKEVEKGRGELKKWYKLKAEIEGSYILPSLEITYRDDVGEHTVKTAQIFVDVKSVIDENAKDIKDIKNQEEVPLNYRLLIIVFATLLLAIILAITGIILYKRRKRRMMAKIVEPPHEIAFKELDNLIKQNLCEHGKYKEHYFILSEILRRYFESRFNIQAIDRTTEELMPLVHNHEEIVVDVKKIFNKFLFDTDIVKFAKYIPSEKEIENIMNESFSIINKTKQQNMENKGDKFHV